MQQRIKVSHAAFLMGDTVPTIKKRIRTGELVGYIDDGSWYVDVASLNAYLEARRFKRLAKRHKTSTAPVE